MKITVEHDADGNPISAGFSTHPDMNMTLKPRRGYYVSECEVDEIRGHRDHEHLRSIVKDYRIHAGEGKPRLVRKHM